MNYVRLFWIDQLRGFLFLWVIMSHTLMAPSWLKWLYEPFFLAAFFMLSGYLYHHKPFVQKAKGIVNGLLIPYFVYSLLLAVIASVRVPDVNHFVQQFYNAFVLGGDNLWFIPCLLLMELLFSIFCALTDDSKVGKMVLMMLAVVAYFMLTSVSKHHLPWNMDTALWCLLYFVIGNLQNQVNLSNRGIIWAGVLAYLVLAVLIGVWEQGKGVTDLHNNQVVNQYTFLLLSILGSCTVLHGASLIKFNSSLLAALGRYTLFSFPFHGYLIRPLNKLYKLILGASLPRYEAWLAILSVLTVAVLLVYVGRFLEKQCPFLLGKVKVIK